MRPVRVPPPRRRDPQRRLLINRDLERRAVECGQPAIVAGELAKSALFVPMLSRRRGRPAILLHREPRAGGCLQRLGRRLLTTLAVEPRRRPRERPAVRRDEAAPDRDERAGRRAGADQRRPARACPRTSTSRRCTTWSATRSRRSSMPRWSTSGSFDREAGLVRFPYTIERGVRFPRPAADRSAPIQQEFIRDRASRSSSIGDVNEWYAAHGVTPRRSSRASRPSPSLFVPLIVGERGPRPDLAPEPRPRGCLLATPTSASSRRSRRASRSPSRTRACSTRPSGSCPRRTSGPPSWRSSTTSSTASPRSSTGSRCTTWSATGSRRSSTPRSSTSRVVEPELDQVRFLYAIERGVRFPEETLPIIGPRKQVIATRKPLVMNRDVEARARELGQTPEMTSGEKPKSAVWVPLLVGDEVRGIISLQNIDREDAFSDSDVELLTTLAASLSVALENVRLIDETRQRLAELATVNEVGQALSSQLDLDTLLELVGEQMRQTFDADICYVALHDVPNDRIVFPYFHEVGSARQREPFAVRRGADLADPDRPRAAAPQPPGGLGRDRRRRRRARGEVLPRRADPGRRRRRSARSASRARPARAASASPTRGSSRRSPRTSASRSRTPGSTRRPTAAATRWRSWRRSARRSRRRSTPSRSSSGSASASTPCSNADTTALFLAEPDGRTFRAILAIGELAEAITRRLDRRGRGDHRRRRSGPRTPEFVNDASARPADDRHPGDRGAQPGDRAADGRAAASPATASPAWRPSGDRAASRSSQADLDFLVGPGPPGVDRHRERPPLRGGPGGDRPRPRARTRPRARSSPR